MLVPATAICAGVYVCSSNARRSARCLQASVSDLGNAAYAASRGELSELASSIVHIPMHLVDSSIYAAAIVIPIFPIGEVWAAFRRQT